MRTLTSARSPRDWLRSVAFAATVLGSTACTTNTVVKSVAAPAGVPAAGVTVNGVGKVSGKPDIARGNIGFEARAATAEAAITEVNRRMAEVISAVKQAGVAEKDIRTDTISLNFERTPEPPQPLALAPSAAAANPGAVAAAGPRSVAGKPLGGVAPAAPPSALPLGFYTATNSVAVTIRRLEQTGQVLSAATAAGANQLYGLHFEIEDPSALLVEARQKAVADARDRADRLARLAGVKLGPPVSISESNNEGRLPSPAYADVSMRAGNTTPVELGQISVSASVVVVYALAESGQ